MAKYKKLPLEVEATRWFKNGDHPGDACETFTGEDGNPLRGEGKVVRFFRHSAIPGNIPCTACGIDLHHHGWIEEGSEGQRIVCPGDWVATGPAGDHYPIKNRIFELTYVLSAVQ